MKSSLRAALALGVLALASAQASASPVNLTSGSTHIEFTNTPNPGMFEINVGAGVTGAVFQLRETVEDWKTYTYQLWTDADANVGTMALGTMVGASWSWTDIGDSAANLANTNVYRALVPGSQYVLALSSADSNAFGVSTQVSAVPLPGAALLFGSALMGFGALRRKQKSAGKSEMAAA